MKVILHLSTNCNLSCKYCYASKTRYAGVMSLDTAKTAVHLASREGKESFCVSFFGGEPLLHFDLIREIVNYARQTAQAHAQQVAFRMSTNGLLFTPDVLDYCRENAILLAVSCDGNRTAHDAQRVFDDGSGSFDAFNVQLPEILKRCPLTVFASVITPQSVPYLYESVQWMWNHGIRYMAHQLDFADETWDENSFAVLTNQYRALCTWYLEKTRSGKYFYLNLIDDKLKTHIQRDFLASVPCDFGISKVSVAPDGTLFPCVRFVSDAPAALSYAIGHVSTGFTDLRIQLSHKSLSPKPVCVNCAYVGRCIQYCGCNNFTSTGEIDRVHPLVCEHERMLIPLCDELGAILWQERNPSFLAKHYRIDLARFPFLGTYDME